MNESQAQFPTIYLPSVGQLSSNTSEWQLPEDPGTGIDVRGFRFVGNISVSDARLQQAFASFAGRELTPRQIYSMTDLVKHIYKLNDIAATAQVPPQDVVDGVVTIEIREASFVGVELDYGFEESFNVDLERIEAVAGYNVGANPPLRISEMERGQLLAIDLHGVAVSGGHHPDEAGDQLLELWVENTPLYSGTVELENTGNKDSGAQQLVLTSLYSSPFNRGGATYINAIKSEGLNFASLAYRGPVGFDGATVDLQLGLLEAKVNSGSESGQSYSLGYRYPILRTVSQNLFFSAMAERRELGYQLDTLDLSLDGNRAFQGARLTYNGELTFGKAFQTLSGYVSYTRFYDSGWRYSTRLSGQYATEPLDAAERFLITGPDALRGYQSGELLGDTAALLRLDINKRITNKLSLGAFYDTSIIKPQQNQSSSLYLADIGLQGRIRFTQDISLGLSIAQALRDSSGPTVKGDQQLYANLIFAF